MMMYIVLYLVVSFILTALLIWVDWRHNFTYYTIPGLIVLFVIFSCGFCIFGWVAYLLENKSSDTRFHRWMDEHAP